MVVEEFLAGFNRDIDGAGYKGRVQTPVRAVLRLIERPAPGHVDAQRENRLVACGDGSRSVALVGVEVDDPGAADAILGLQPAQGDDQVVDQAEPRAAIFLGVVHAAAEVETEPAFQCRPSALNRSRRPPENPFEEGRQRETGASRVETVVISAGVDQLVGARDFGFQAVRKQPVDIIRGVDP